MNCINFYLVIFFQDFKEKKNKERKINFFLFMAHLFIQR